MENSFLKEQADRCRGLAEHADPFIKRRLLDLAEKYDSQLSRPSRATRSLIPGSLLEAGLQKQPEPVTGKLVTAKQVRLTG